MRVLGLDLTGTTGSIAIVDDGRTVAEEVLASPDGFGHLLFDRLQDLLFRVGLKAAQMDCFASASGPGSFTGVRIGLAAVKGLAEATSKAAIGISNLRAVASLGEAALRVPVLDARRGDVFAALYGAGLREMVPETVGKLEDFAALLKANAAGPFAARCADAELDVQFIATDTTWLRGLLAGKFLNWPIVQSPLALATAVARCAALAIEGGASGDPALLDANYVRRSDAELFWHDR